MSPKLISAQRSLHIAEKKYACTHMLRSACAHPPSSPYTLTCRPHYLIYGRLNQIPYLVGKTDHNVGGLACILGLTNPHNQSPQLPRNVTPRDQWCSPWSLFLSFFQYLFFSYKKNKIKSILFFFLRYEYFSARGCSLHVFFPNVRFTPSSSHAAGSFFSSESNDAPPNFHLFVRGV